MDLRKVMLGLTGQSELISGKEKLLTSDVLDTELTIREVDLFGDYSVIVFEEYPDKFLFGGAILSDLVKGIVDNNLKDDVRQQGLKVKLTSVQSKKSKKFYTKVILL